jgi:hypothetical protein
MTIIAITTPQLRDHRDRPEAAVQRGQRRARVEAEPPEPQDQHAEAEERHVVPRDRARRPVAGVLPAPGPEPQQDRQGGGRGADVDDDRAREVLHVHRAGQPAAAEDPVRDDRVDERREHERVDDVDAELDALERRAPHDRQRDGAEHELEEPQRLGRHPVLI